MAEVKTSSRKVTSLDGPVKLLETTCHCDQCRRVFFPLRETLGFDAREFTPQAVLRITITAVVECDGGRIRTREMSRGP